MNQTIYLQVDAQGFVSDFKLTAADGYKSVTVPLAWVSDLMTYPTKFSVVDGVLEAPGNLPSVSIDELKKQLDTANQTISQQGTTIDSQGQKISQQATTITQLQKIAGQLTAQVAKQNVAGATNATTEQEG
ncbi:hypothetical protein [Lactiplantibacillus xiangfangensis]|uniref:hypothetical protein n=1 Tax=Lactiplantibacillus xiangfangensis TaxID=942150 RepID=UPI00385061D5